MSRASTTKISRSALVTICIAVVGVCLVNAHINRLHAIQSAVAAQDLEPSFSAFGDTDSLDGHHLAIGVVGDELSRAGSPNIPDAMARTLVDQKDAASVVVLNNARGSTGTCEWVPLSQSGLLTGALADFQARRVRYVVIDLGTYDSAGSAPLPPALFAVQLKQIVRVFTHVGDKVLLESPPTPHNGANKSRWDTAAPARIAAYRKSMSELANGQTVFCGGGQPDAGDGVQAGRRWAGDFARSFLQ